MQKQTIRKPHIGFVWVVFLLFTLGIGLAFWSNIVSHHKTLEENIEDLLVSVESYKSAQIHSWFHERLADAQVFSARIFFYDNYKKYLENPSAYPEIKQTIIKVLDIMADAYGYESVQVIDVTGKNIITSSNPQTCNLVSASASALVSQVVHERKPTISDLYMCPHQQKPELDFLAPLVRGNEDQPVLGVLILKVDPEESLYPLLNKWPVPSATAETLIVRRDGDKATYLSNLRFKENARLLYQIPLVDENIPAVAAVLGLTGHIHGLDYRGEPVFAYISAVPETPWFLVAKVDVEEVYKDFFKYSAFRIVFAIALIIGMAVFIYTFLNRQENIRLQSVLDAEQQRRALFEHLGTAIKYANDSFLLANETGKLIEVNDRTEEVFRYTRAELSGADIQMLVAPEDLLSWDNHAALIATQGTSRFEVVLKRKDATTFIADVAARKFFIDETQYIQYIVRDITDLKRREDALRESEARYRLFVDNFLGIAYQSAVGTHKPDVMMGMVEEITGYRSEEFLNGSITWESIVLPIDAHIVHSEIDRLERVANHIANATYRIVKKDGTIRHINDLARLIEKADGIKMVQGSIYDITPQVEAENALRESERRLVTLMSNLPGMVYRCHNDRYWTMEFVSFGCLGLTGYPPEMIVLNRAVAYASLIHPEDEERVWDTIQKAAGAKKNYTLEYRIRTRSGEEKWVWEQGSAVYTASGEVECLEGIIIDETQRKQVEQSLRLTLQEMETFNKVSMERELRITELKKRIKELEDNRQT